MEAGGPICEELNPWDWLIFLCVGWKSSWSSPRICRKHALGEDEAEETGDSVWGGHLLCGCILTLSHVGPCPAWPYEATKWCKLSTGKKNCITGQQNTAQNGKQDLLLWLVVMVVKLSQLLQFSKSKWICKTFRGQHEQRWGGPARTGNGPVNFIL